MLIGQTNGVVSPECEELRQRMAAILAAAKSKPVVEQYQDLSSDCDRHDPSANTNRRMVNNVQEVAAVGSCMSKQLRRSIFYGFPILVAAALIGLYVYGGMYGINVVLRRGGYIWLPISADDTRISNSMRLALRGSLPAAVAGEPEWRLVAKGFKVAELPVFAEGSMVDQILLARIDPALYRFQVHNAPAGNRELGNWMKETGAVLVINGSYFTRFGTPATPIMSQGRLLGPREYDSRHGAFVASAASVALVDLSQQDWRKAFAGSTDAMVSYPLLIAADGTTRVKGDARWLANRSFVGQDGAGRIVLGTTR